MSSCPRLRPTTMLQAGRSSLPQRLLQADHYSLPLRVLQAELFYFETKKIGVGRSSLLRPGQAPHDHAAGGPFYFATKKIGVGRGAVATTTAAGGTVLLCRHDGAASILDFRPRLANRCSRGAILGRNRAVILDFRPRLANRCSQEAKTRAILASILDFRPRLANRCSQEVKTGQSLQPKGVRHCAATGECRMGRDFGRRSRPWLREREGPAAQRREGKHRRCAPVRSPCPQADSAAGTRPCPQAARPRRTTQKVPTHS